MVKMDMTPPMVKLSRDEAGPWALPAVMMSDRADTEADFGTRPPLGEALDFSGAGSRGPPRRRPRPASKALGVDCRAPVLLLRRRAWLRAAGSARGLQGEGVSVALPSHHSAPPSSGGKVCVDTVQPPGLCPGSSFFLQNLPTLLSLESSILQFPSSRKPSLHPLDP